MRISLKQVFSVETRREILFDNGSLEQGSNSWEATLTGVQNFELLSEAFGKTKHVKVKFISVDGDEGEASVTVVPIFTSVSFQLLGDGKPPFSI